MATWGLFRAAGERRRSHRVLVPPNALSKKFMQAISYKIFQIYRISQGMTVTNKGLGMGVDVNARA